MTRKFKVSLDSGANHCSARETEVTLDELGVTEGEWDSMAVDAKDKLMQEIAFETLEWYWEEV